MNKIAEFFAEIGIIADIEKLREIDKIFENINKNVSKNSKNYKDLSNAFKNINSSLRTNPAKDFTKDVKVAASAGAMLAESFSAVLFTGAAIPAVLLATYYALNKIVTAASQLSINLRNVHLQTGLTQSSLLKWQQIATVANPNINAGQFLQVMAGVQQNIAAIRLGLGGNVRPYQLLGMSIVGKDAFSILEELRKKAHEFKGLRRSWLTLLAQQMGFSADIIPMLYMPEKQFQDLKKISIVSEENQKKLVALRQSYSELGLELRNFGIDFIVSFQGPLKWFADELIREIRNIEKAGHYIKLFIEDILLLGEKLQGLEKKLDKFYKKRPITVAASPTLSTLTYAQKMASYYDHHRRYSNYTFNISGEKSTDLAYMLKDIVEANEHTYSQQNNGPKR